jgi:hypothetical protein
VSLRAADERAHAPGAEGWWETWHLDVASADGTGVFARLACSPALGFAWWWTYFVLPDVEGVGVVRDHEVPLPRQGLEIRADGLWGEMTCETPFEHWTYGVEAFGVRLDDPTDALRGEIGERLAVGLDIEWEIEPGAAQPHERAAGGSVAGYAQMGVVHGEVLLGRSRIELDAHGLRSHWWGAPSFDRPASSAWMHAPALDVSFVRGADHVDGFVAARESGHRPIVGVDEEVQRDAEGLPVVGRYVVDDDLEIDIEVLGTALIPVAGGAAGGNARITRSLCRFDAGAEPGTGVARIGNGWASRIDPE